MSLENAWFLALLVGLGFWLVALLLTLVWDRRRLRANLAGKMLKKHAPVDMPIVSSDNLLFGAEPFSLVQTRSSSSSSSETADSSGSLENVVVSDYSEVATSELTDDATDLLQDAQKDGVTGGRKCNELSTETPKKGIRLVEEINSWS